MTEFFTVNTVSKHLKSSRSHIYYLIEKGRLEQVVHENKFVITKGSVDRYQLLKLQLESIKREMQKEYYKNGKE